MIGLAIFSLCLACFIYLLLRSYFSPLRHIPQPWSWPLLYHTPYFLFQKDHLGVIEKWADRFKEEGIFRFDALTNISGTLVVVLNPEYIKTLLSRPESFKRSDFMQMFFPLTGDGLLNATGDNHRFQKKVLSKVFSLSQLKNYIPIFRRHTDILIQVWKDLMTDNPRGKTIAVKEYFRNMSFDIIGEAGFGYHFNSQTENPGEFILSFKKTIEEVLNPLSQILLRIFPLLHYLPFGPAKIIKNVTCSASKILDEILNTRKERIADGLIVDEDNIDMLSIMLNEKDEKNNKGFSEQLIKDNVYTFFFAGHETTATQLPGIVYYFAKFPDFQEKARAEIDEMLNGKDDFDIDDMSQLAYTSAFIKEALRMYPVVPVNGRETHIDISLGKYKIPKGTTLFFPTHFLNKDSGIFDRGDEFIPERYLENSQMKNGTSFSFGYGPYSCIGKNFAVLEMKVVIVRLLQTFKFELAPGFEEFARSNMITIKTDPEINVRIKLL